MKIWLFEGAHVTDSYHSGGSVMIIAETEGRVKQLLLEHPGVQLEEEDWKYVRTFPTHSYVPEEVFIFPDSGCC